VSERSETKRHGAILLAGGRASRVDGATKPLFDVGGRTLLGAAVEAVRAVDARPITVAGPEAAASDVGVDLDGVDFVREDPPFGGPVAGGVAALDAWRTGDVVPEWTFLLACDVPGIGAAVARLAQDVLLLPGDSDGVCLADASGRPQWLAGVYRTEALTRTAGALDDRGRDAPVRALVADLAIAVVRAPADETDDVDTWEDLNRARAAAGQDAYDTHRTEEAR